MPGYPAHPILRGRPLAWQALAALLGSWLVAASAWASVPMAPVPMTLQTYAVLLVGALGGWRLGMAAIALYLAQGALGLPLFAGGKSGVAVLTGPTGGYLMAFLPAAALAGWLAGRARPWPALLLAMLAAHALILALGAGWLGLLKGWQVAWTAGTLPFLPGAAVKSALAAATVLAVRRVFRIP